MSDEDELDSLRRDAARWRALMASQRMHSIGSSGFDIKLIDPKGPRLVENMVATARPGANLLIGMEFWDVHSAFGDPRFPDKFERDLLTLYVDCIRGRP